MNYAKYIKEVSAVHVVLLCANTCRTSSRSVLVRTTCADGSRQCFGTHDDEKFLDAGLEQTWRLWLFQGG
jgi:hypothetical protein